MSEPVQTQHAAQPPNATPSQIGPRPPVRLASSMRGRLVVLALILLGLAAGSITALYWKYGITQADTSKKSASETAVENAPARSNTGPADAEASEPPAADPQPTESNP